MKKLNDKGIAHLLLVAIFVVLAGIAYVGYRVYQNSKDKPKTVKTQTSQAESTEDEAEEAKPSSVPEGWTVFEDSASGIKFTYPETWKTNGVFSSALEVNESSKAVIYEGCGDPICEVKYNPSTKKVTGRGGSEVKQPVATLGPSSAYLIAEKGSFNCGSYGLLIPLGEKVIQSRLSLCTKPSGPNDHELGNGSLSYEQVVIDLKKALGLLIVN